MNKVKKKEKHVPKELCSVCNIRIDHTSMEQHLKGKKHVSLSNQVKIKKRIYEKISHEGICITGISSSITNDTLIKHFKKFGQVVALLRNETEKDAVLQFRRSNQANAALRCSHHVEGSLLGVKPRKPFEYLSSSSLGSVGLFDQIEVFKRELEETLKSNSRMTVDEQFLSLVKIIEITDEEKQRKYKIISSLKEWLSIEFPGCCLHLFGSSVSGLAFRNDSDLDISLDIPKSAEGLVTDASLSVEDPSDSKREYMLQTLRRASNIIRSHPDITDMFVISNARIPVSKFIYTRTGVKCDLTCNNIIGVQNSKLLHSLQSLDVRIRPYFYALKFWAKSHRLISSPESTLSSYALTLLAVFYLQQTEPSIVPTIESLKKQVPLGEQSYCNGWNVSFKHPLDIENLPTHANRNMSVMDLLIGFFRFYQQFNANEMVVCPSVGECLLKSEFIDASPSSEYPVTLCNKQGSSRPSLKISVLTVQDPFELNFNVTFNFRHFEWFQSLCELAERMCLRIVDLKKNTEQSIVTLFKAPFKTKFASKAIKSLNQSSVLLNFTSIDGLGSFENAKKLCHSVGQFISSLFIFSYGIRVDETTQLERKEQKIDCTDLDVLLENDSDVKWRTNYLMTVEYDVFNKRDELTHEIQNGDDKSSLLDQERAITSLISCRYASLKKVQTFAIVNFSMTCDVNLPNVGLHFGNRDIPESVFFEFVRNLRHCVSKSVKNHLIVSNFAYKLN